MPSKEHRRLEESRARTSHWKHWGPYVSERAWGTVREDYSKDGHAWEYLPHDHARSKAYRWNEDGIAGVSDRQQLICFAVAMWNGRDPILKERLFGVTGHEGNHGEDVKEVYYYLDSTPTHSYMRYLYKYPQSAYPYAAIVAENRARSRDEPEVDLVDTGAFDGDRYFDVDVAYAKGSPEDLLVRISVTNHGPEAARMVLAPTLWFRNTWSWERGAYRPSMREADGLSATHARTRVVEVSHERYGARELRCEGADEIVFTENDTNDERLYGTKNATPFVKDAFHAYLVDGDRAAVNPAKTGTKAAAVYDLFLAPGETRVVAMRFAPPSAFRGDRGVGADFDAVFDERIQDADAFFAEVIPSTAAPDAQLVMRQALAGMLWGKQFYHYVVEPWLDGDAAMPPPPPERLHGRNADWPHLFNADVISMPDKWEYPWYAAWDLAFHAVALAIVDIEFAKEQLILLLREWYMHPNGQIPAYEWNLSDVNPPVHAWAAWRVYSMEKSKTGRGDRKFLERIFHKLLLNFTWWVNRKDAEGNNVFQGGFLGLDNIGIFDRSSELPTGGFIEQSDGTSWMGMYCLNMLSIALELARENDGYEDVASKFWEHFVYIANAINSLGLWDDEDGLYYDVLNLPNGTHVPIRLRSMVGLIPLFGVLTIEDKQLSALTGFKRRLEWFIDNRPDLVRHCANMRRLGQEDRRLLSIVSRKRLLRVLRVMLDEAEFLSEYGIRSLSRRHREQPYVFEWSGVVYRVDYEPAESPSGLFGGNSNWRGPIWFPVNYLLIEALEEFHRYFGQTLTVEFPTGSGVQKTLQDVAHELSERLVSIFVRNAKGRRPCYGNETRFQIDPQFRDRMFFHEYFNGDDGTGLGASHQTGWTGLVANLIAFGSSRSTVAGEPTK